MVFPNKTFYWPRHIAIAFVLLTFINLLVIFAPNILGIFGVIGRFLGPKSDLNLYLNDAKSMVMCDDVLHRCHICPLSHLHLPSCLLHSHCTQRRRTFVLSAQNLGECLYNL